MKPNCFTLITSDHVKIAVDYYSKGNRPIVIVAPGFFQHKSSKTFQKIKDDLFREFDVVIFDFRGHGKSTGAFTFLAHEVKDLEAVVDFVEKEHRPFGILGFSLGAAASLIYAAHKKNIKSLILVSTPTAFDHIRMKFWLPEAIRIGLRSLIEGGRVWPGWLFHKKHNPIDFIHNLDQTPILFLHGDPDPIVHTSHSKFLFEKAKGKNKKLEIILGASHGEEMFVRFPDKLNQLITQWFHETLLK